MEKGNGSTFRVYMQVNINSLHPLSAIDPLVIHLQPSARLVMYDGDWLTFCLPDANCLGCPA